MSIHEASSDSLLSLSDVLKAVEGKLLSKNYSDANFSFTSVATDSRNCTKGSLFIPLIGSVDGHEYIQNSYDNGARAVFVNDFYAGFHDHEIRKLTGNGMCVISVSHTMYALQKLAAFYLSQFSMLRKIGITGSSGKTTTKEILVSLLSQKYSVVCNQGNFNSETGLPLSVFSVRSCHQYGVFEMGMNRKGEIGELAGVLKPHYGIITNIGTAHIGILGTKAAIAEEKKRIFSYFSKDCVAVIPCNDEYSDFLQNDIKGSIVCYGDGKEDGITHVEDKGLKGTSFLLKGENITFPLPGKYNFLNALVSIKVALLEGLTVSEIKKGLESITPLFGRSEILEVAITIIQDCYNANPDSMKAACSFFETLSWEGKKWYILADMLELGSDSEYSHRELGSLLTSSNADGVFLLGQEMSYAYEELRNNSKPCVFYNSGKRQSDYEEFEKLVCSNIHSGDLLLIKGSRGMKLERITEKLKALYPLHDDKGVRS